MEHTENKKQESMDNNQIAMKVSAVSIAVNLILSVLKLIAGIVAHSGAMVSDAIHSASDVGSTLIVIVGVRLSGKQSDQEHPYGHERMECVSSIILSGLLLATGIGIGISGLENIVKSTSGKAIEIPGMLALIAAVVSIVVKEWMFWYTRGAAKKIQFRCFDGRCVASSFRRHVFSRSVCWYLWSKDGISHSGSNCQCGDLPSDRESID